MSEFIKSLFDIETRHGFVFLLILSLLSIFPFFYLLFAALKWSIYLWKTGFLLPPSL
jgi:uncharacterized membrane protein YdjX (TVP38/TMEM64 family)